MTLLLAIVLAQTSLGGSTSLSREDPVQLYQSATKLGQVTRLSCTPPLLCARTGSSIGTGTVSINGLSSAPGDDQVLVGNGTVFQLKTIPDCDTASSALQYDVTTNAWGCATISGGSNHNLISATHSDTTGTPAQGDIIYRNGSALWTLLPAGSTNQVLHSGTTPSWASVADGDLANNYSGVGSCGANTWANVLNDNAAPTCAQPGFGNLSGTATDGQIPNNITIDLAATASALASDPTDCGANQYATTIAANGNLTCAQPAFGGITGTVTDGQLANNYSGVGACGANTWASTLNDNASPTCTQPGFSNISGTVAIEQGGTTETVSTEDAVLVGASTTDWVPKVLPDCDTATSALQYDQATNAFSCGAPAPTHTLVSATHTDTSGSPANDDILIRGASAWELKSIPSCSDPAASKLLYNSTTNTISCGTDQTAVGSANFLETTITFSNTGGAGAVVVTGQAWVTGTSKITCTPFNDGSVTNNTDEVYQVANFSTVVSARSAGVGFTLSAYSAFGVSGDFKFHCTGG